MDIDKFHKRIYAENTAATGLYFPLHSENRPVMKVWYELNNYLHQCHVADTYDTCEGSVI